MTAGFPIAPVDRVTSKVGQTQIRAFPGDDGKDVISLVKHTSDGVVRSMLTRVPLNPAKGETYPMPYRTPEGQWKTRQIVTAAGYDKLNQFAGMSFIQPATVMGDDGQQRPNPYMHREGGELLWVRVRTIGVGRNAAGSLVVRDYTLNYDLSLYLAQDLYSKWSGRKSDTPKQWGTLHASDAVPKVQPGHKAMALPWGVTLVVDLGHKDVVGLIAEHINRMRFAERNALTICTRNILKKHLGAAILGDELTVPVVHWPQADRDWRRVAEAAAQADAGEIQVEGEVIEVDRASETISDPDEIDATLAGEADEDEARTAGEGSDVASPSVDVPVSTAAAPASHSNDDLDAQAIKAQLRDTWQRLDPESRDRAIKQAGLSEISELAACNEPGRLSEIQRAFEDVALRLAEDKAAQAKATGKQGTLI